MKVTLSLKIKIVHDKNSTQLLKFSCPKKSFVSFHLLLFIYSYVKTVKMYSEPCQIFMTELFPKTVKWVLVGNCFCKNAPSWLFFRSSNTPLVLTVCHYYATYAFQSESTLFSCLWVAWISRNALLEAVAIFEITGTGLEPTTT